MKSAYDPVYFDAARCATRPFDQFFWSLFQRLALCRSSASIHSVQRPNPFRQTIFAPFFMLIAMPEPLHRPARAVALHQPPRLRDIVFARCACERQTQRPKAELIFAASERR